MESYINIVGRLLLCIATFVGIGKDFFKEREKRQNEKPEVNENQK